MTERDRMRELFDALGVLYGAGSARLFGEAKNGVDFVLSVHGTLFCFDADGKYLGARYDETGSWHARKR